MKAITHEEMQWLERTMEVVCNSVHPIISSDMQAELKKLKLLVSEMRVLSSNPSDPDAINRFIEIFTGHKETPCE